MSFYDEPKLKLLPVREHPGFRVRHNPNACNLIELLATIIGGQYQIEIAEELIKHFGGPRGLVNATVPELISRIDGIGESTALRIKASLALSSYLLRPEDPQASVRSPEDIYAIINYQLANREQEYVFVLMFNIRNNLLDIAEIAHGSLNQCDIRIAEVFRPALRANSAAIAIAHNHPSGDPTPSIDDIAFTKTLVDIGKNLGVEILDHLIVGQGQFVSLKRRKLGGL